MIDVDKIAQLAVEASELQKIVIGGVTYTNREVYQPNYSPVSTCKITTLSGLMDLAALLMDTMKPEDLLFHIVSPTEVKLCSPWNTELQSQNWGLAKHPIEPFPFNSFLSQDDFIIKCMTLLEATEGREQIMATASNLIEESKTEAKDDGLSQEIVLKNKTGVSRLSVRNPISLIANLTFSEVEQPQIEVVLRLRKSDGLPRIGLFICDNGKWIVQSTENIKNFLLSKNLGIVVVG